MSKITLLPITGGFNLSAINNNFQKIQEELNSKVLYRDNPTGEPNQLTSPIDMNGQHIYNLPEPQLVHEPARFGDIKNLVDGLKDVDAQVLLAQEAALASETSADRAKDEADRAEAAAGSTDAGNLKIFSTRSAAVASLPFLLEGQIVEVEVDEDHQSKRTRNKVIGGALVFTSLLQGNPVTELETVTSLTRSVTLNDSHKYLRFTSSGSKVANFSSTSPFVGGEEIEISNRSAAGALSLKTEGMVINPVRGTSLLLSPGDSVKLKAVSATVLDMLYGSNTEVFSLPKIIDENATFNDEGTAITGWTPTGATLSTSNSYVRATKTAAVGATCTMNKPWTFTPNNRDFILYGKIRASAVSQFDATVFTIYNGSKEVAIWLGYTGTTYALGASCILGNQGASIVKAPITTTGLDYHVTAVEFALQYDTKFGQLNCWFREPDGRWKLKARLTCDYVSHTQIAVSKHTDAPVSSWFEFDYLTLCQPNIIAIGDSHCAGATLFDPNLTLALSDDESTWMRHCPIYPSFRNNLIVNKGVGAQTSAVINARINEVTRENPRVVFLHASSNDTPSTVTKAVRRANIQSSITAINSLGQQVVLLNSLYGTSTYINNPEYRDYMKSWWAEDKENLEGLSAAIDIMQPIKSTTDFLSDGLAAADKVHVTPTGFNLIGSYIKSKE